MEQHYGEYWYLAFLLSAVLTWGIGLAPPLLLRFAILKRPISKKVSITLVVLFWFLNVLIFTALGSTSKTHSVLFFVAWASFAILRKGSQKQKGEGKAVNIKEDTEATGETTSDERPNNAVNHIVAWTKQKISALVFISLIVVLVLILSTIEPHSSIAQEKSAYPESQASVAYLQQTRDLSTPSKRLVGRWRNVDNNGEIYFSPIESELRLGTYRLHNQGGQVGPPTRIRILRENVSGTELVYKAYNEGLQRLGIEIGLDLSLSDIRCCVSTDGTTMTLEYTMGGDLRFSVYRYIDSEPFEE